jgi:CDP-4-dehydro-6-deoxyglucose reductase
MSFQISVEPIGILFQADTNETLLTASIRQGIGLPYGCKDGACGSCKCKKLSGTVVHGPYQAKALSDEEESNGWVLTCCATAQSDVVLESRQVSKDGCLPVKKMPVRVINLQKASHDVMVMKLQLPTTEPIKFRAGQYIEIILRDGSRRSYSMANSPHTLEQSPPMLELHIRHVPGGKFTDQVFSTIKEKEVLRAEGPFGTFYLREDSKKPMVLLASGTGFAPIKALVEHMCHQGINRPATLYWGGRRPDDLYMSQWIETQCAAMPNLKYVPVISNTEAADNWNGRTGFVHQAVLQDHPDLSSFQVYACGAPIVIESALEDFTSKAGLPLDEFYADSFTSSTDK